MLTWSICVFFFNLTAIAAQIQCCQQFDITYPTVHSFLLNFLLNNYAEEMGFSLLLTITQDSDGFMILQSAS